MNAAEGFLTAFGGMTTHAALVARQMGKVCIVGCEALSFDYHGAHDDGRARRRATVVIARATGSRSTASPARSSRAARDDAVGGGAGAHREEARRPRTRPSTSGSPS